MAFEPNDSGWPQISFEFVSIETPESDSEACSHLIAAGEFRGASNILLFETEPIGDAYRALLAFAASHCHAFALVWQDQLRFDESAHEAARRLEPWSARPAVAGVWRVSLRRRLATMVQGRRGLDRGALGNGRALRLAFTATPGKPDLLLSRRERLGRRRLP